jgi:negative regulator of sigma-B (phosphoserine phosphatase)
MSTSQRRSNRPPAALKNPLAPSTFSSERVAAAWISRPRVGEDQCGDGVLLRELGDKATLIAVIDALGHGPRAAEIAEASIKYLSSAAVTEDSNVMMIVDGLHSALKDTRGAAALVMLIKSTNAIEICSVGNIELRSTNTKLPYVLTPGVLGVRLRNPKLCTAKATPTGERFLLYSDGISGRFDLRPFRTHSASDLTTHIFTTHRHAHDDATVVVLDILPKP